MRQFRLHRSWRVPNGLITDHVTLERAIEASTAYEATAAALSEGDFLVNNGSNLAWLTDERDSMVWSLRLDDEDMVQRP